MEAAVLERELDPDDVGGPRCIRAIEEFLARCGVPERPRARVALVLEEALMNLAMHGAYGTDAPRATVRVELLPDRIELALSDNGRPFDPTATEPPPLPTTLTRAAPGGQGLRLLRRFTRELQYQRAEGWNQLTMRLDRR